MPSVGKMYKLIMGMNAIYSKEVIFILVNWLFKFIIF